jgi:hypothetical protein
MTAAHAGSVVDEAIKLFGTYGPRGTGDVRAVWLPLDMVGEDATRQAVRAVRRRVSSTLQKSCWTPSTNVTGIWSQ